MTTFSVNMSISFIYVLLAIILKGQICNSFHWYVSKWSSCIARDNCNKPGYKTRVVNCQNRNGHILANHKCVSKKNNTRPSIWEPCVPKTCLSKLVKSIKVQKGDWGECKAVPLNTWNQVRNKLVNRNETGEFPDCEKNSVGVAFISENKFTCHIRYKSRSHKKVQIDLDSCEKRLDLELTKVRFCFFACINTCALSAWSEWKYCPQCRTHKTRYKTRQPMSLQKVGQYKNICPQMVKIKNKTDTSIKKHQFKVSRWNSGTTIKDKKKYRSHLPKISLKQRKVICIDSNGIICNQSSFNISSKKIMMSDYDCTVGSWTNWGNCVSHENKIIQFRKRSIKMLPSGDGKACSSLSQNRTCSSVKNESLNMDLDFKWFLSDWTSCQKTSTTWKNFKELGCNVTFATRSVFCVKVRHVRKGLIKPVADASCRHHERPSTKTACDVTCLSGCNYGAWNEWSNCRHDMIRRIRKPSVASHQCPQIVQKKKCGPYWSKIESQVCVVSNITSQCGRGFMNHTLVCMNGNNKATGKRQCRKLPKPDEQESCFIPCSNNTLKIQKHVYTFNMNKSLTQLDTNDYYWYTSSWSACVAMKTKSSYTRHCVLGYSRRQVFCVNKTPTNRVNSSFCAGLFKFHNLRRCNICRKNCIVSTWSDWEPPCEAICSLLELKTPLATQRKRFVISYGNDYGVKCPEKVVETKECLLCARYGWVAKDWDICIHRVPSSMPSAHPDLMKGVQIRGVYCSNGRSMVDDEICLKTRKPKPNLSRDCVINSLVSCNLLPWTKWSKCTRKCGQGTQQRTRTYTSDRCKVYPNIEYHQSRTCNIQKCRDYFATIGPWGVCHRIGEPLKCSPYGPFTTLGIQNRNVSCHTLDGSHVANEYCESDVNKIGSVETARNCIVPCVRDCRLQEWSNWSACSASCGSGISVRMRTVNEHHTKGGDACPSTNPVTERVPCKIRDCFSFQWSVGDWGNCTLKNDSSVCGAGTRRRTINCIEKITNESVHSSRCDTKTRPDEYEECQLFCPDQCVVSDWIMWDNCTKACRMGETGVRVKQRYVINEGPSMDPCPSLEEVDKCGECFSYELKPTSWSSCVLQRDNDDCGIGLQTRLVDCFRNDGEIVSGDNCLHIDPLPHYQECEIKCLSECPLSFWTTWSECDNKCDEVGLKTRERFIVDKNIKDTEQCKGKVLKESLTCRIYPCYKLVVGEWDEKCEPVHKTSCGHGMIKRNAVCQRSDGNQLDLDYCLEYVTGAVPIKKNCYIPCWNDCIVSPWSRWSACFGVCDQNFTLRMRGGFRVKTRVIIQTPTSSGRACPAKLEVIESCTDPKCFSFNSIVSNEATGLRNLKVSGSKNELISRVFVENNVPVVPTAVEIEENLAASYDKKLVFDDIKIPDPFKIVHGWQDEDEGYQCLRSDGEELSYGCSPHELPKFRCQCPLRNAKCFQGKYCQCNPGFYPVTSEANVVKCSLLKAVGAKKKSRVTPFNLPIVMLVVLIVFVGYCFMCIGAFVLYNRHKNKSICRIEDILTREQFLTYSSITQQTQRETCTENPSPMVLELECINTNIEHSTDKPALEVGATYENEEEIQETQFEPVSNPNENLL